MKRAKIFVQSVTVTCPYCDDLLPSHYNGSLWWEADELEKVDKEHECDSCDKRFRFVIPKTIKL